MQRLLLNCATGVTTVEPYTPAEVAQRQAETASWAAQKAQEDDALEAREQKARDLDAMLAEWRSRPQRPQ